MYHSAEFRNIDEVLQRHSPEKADEDCLLYSTLLQRFGKANGLTDGRRVHQHLASCGQDRRCTFLANHLINMYGKCGSLEEARLVFDAIFNRNVFSWNTMMAVYAQHGHLDDARRVFDEMPRKNVVSWNTMLSAYATAHDLDEAKQLFDRMPEKDTISWNSVVTAFAHNGHLEEARELFDRIPAPNVASWNTMISAYSHHGEHAKAMEMFRRMPDKQHPDQVTFLSVIDSCAALADVKLVHEMFARSSQRAPEDLKVHNALLNMYGCRFTSLEAARAVFQEMPTKDTISWNTMIAACGRCKRGDEGVWYFARMDLEGQKPDHICLINVLDACKSLEVGKTIHRSIRGCYLETNLLVATSLVNMYGSYGNLHLAREAFDGIQGDKDIMSWTAIIVAYARNGHGDEALSIFSEFGLEGLQPDAVALLTILSACSHAGLLYSGRDFFVAVNGDYGVEAKLEHYRCMVDLLGRVGQVEAAESLIRSMPFQADFISWVTLLGACNTHGDEERGQRVAQFAKKLNPNVASPYVYQVCKLSQ